MSLYPPLQFLGIYWLSPTSVRQPDKPLFWHSAYFIATCGGVTVEQLKQYVQQQDSPTNAEVTAKGSSRPRRRSGRGGDSRD
jgi:hypothetical protein